MDIPRNLRNFYYYALGYPTPTADRWLFGVLIGLKHKDKIQVIYDPIKVLEIVSSREEGDYFRLAYIFQTRFPCRWDTHRFSPFGLRFLQNEFLAFESKPCRIRLDNYQEMQDGHIIQTNEEKLEKAIATYQTKIYELYQANSNKDLDYSHLVVKAATELCATLDKDCLTIECKNISYSVGLDDVDLPPME
jgi:hypothetical protein